PHATVEGERTFASSDFGQKDFVVTLKMPGAVDIGFGDGTIDGASTVTVMPPTLPVVSDIDVPAQASGVVAVTFKLLQAQSFPSDVKVEYSVGGGPFLPATEAPTGSGTRRLAA